MTTLAHVLLLAVPFCDLGSRIAIGQTNKTVRSRALEAAESLPEPERLLADLDAHWSRGAGVWRCGCCGRLWELATQQFHCRHTNDCKAHDFAGCPGQLEVFLLCLRERWCRPNYGLWACTRCRSLEWSGSFPGLVDRRKRVLTYHCGIFTHHVDATGQVARMEPHCIYCFGTGK